MLSVTCYVVNALGWLVGCLRGPDVLWQNCCMDQVAGLYTG